MKTLVEKYDAVLEPELREVCGELDAIERAKAAEKFMRWANQLTESAMRMEPGIVPLVPAPKVPRGFFLVNVAQWQQDKMRSLAHACGCDLRSVLGWAITKTWVELDERLRVARLTGVSPRRCWQFMRGNEKN